MKQHGRGGGRSGQQGEGVRPWVANQNRGLRDRPAQHGYSLSTRLPTTLVGEPLFTSTAPFEPPTTHTRGGFTAGRWRTQHTRRCAPAASRSPTRGVTHTRCSALHTRRVHARAAGRWRTSTARCATRQRRAPRRGTVKRLPMTLPGRRRPSLTRGGSTTTPAAATEPSPPIPQAGEWVRFFDQWSRVCALRSPAVGEARPCSRVQCRPPW